MFVSLSCDSQIEKKKRPPDMWAPKAAKPPKNPFQNVDGGILLDFEN